LGTRAVDIKDGTAGRHAGPSRPRVPLMSISSNIIRLVPLAALFLATVVSAREALVSIDASSKGTRVNPRMYGVFLEEINHGVDGGLYAELVRNRGFEDGRPPEGYELQNGRWLDANGFPAGVEEFGYKVGGLPFWSLVRTGDAAGTMHLDTTGGITKESAYCLRLEVEDLGGGQFGVANEGFFGIGVREGEAYRLSLYARTGGGFNGPLTARLEDANGNTCSNSVSFDDIGSDWKQHQAELIASKTDGKARLVILAGATGSVWLDFVSLFPQKTWKDRPNGLRPDIAQMIADLKPGFVRFPGGCVVEGGTLQTAYNWKDTLGPVESRPERWGPWNYRRTHGMGLFEYLQFFEDMGAEPLWVGFCGQTCIFRRARGETVPMEEMGWVKGNFLDLVEYANGSSESTWGARRAAAGHPAPFDLKYVEIGNENQGPELRDRYIYIHDALKARYPDLKYIADLSWTSDESMRGAVFDIVDRHYYQNPRWFLQRFHEYDDRDRSLPPLYLGEVAVTSGDAGPLRGNLRAALAEGVFLMGCERNADTAQMVSYAPLLAHVDGRTALTDAPPPWHAMIYFDGTRVFGTASYYLWKLFGTNRPDQMVNANVEFANVAQPVIAGQIGVGTWAATAEFKDIRVERAGELLYESDFSQNADGWEPERGRRSRRSTWQVQDGVYRQDREGYALSYFGDESWSNYTLSLKARKLSGNEGFLIVFGRKEGERYWWNLGGWGNSQHAIELNQTPVGRPARGRIESERWYDIKIELDGNRIRCFLDGELIHDVESTPPETFFVNAGRVDASGDLVVKAINIAPEPVRAQVRIGGTIATEKPAKVIVLRSSSLEDNNSLEEPEQIVPQDETLDLARLEFAHEFPRYSLTILRLPLKQQE
jgi:alpha-L-arabinofuranosidase